MKNKKYFYEVFDCVIVVEKIPDDNCSGLIKLEIEYDEDNFREFMLEGFDELGNFFTENNDSDNSQKDRIDKFENIKSIGSFEDKMKFYKEEDGDCYFDEQSIYFEEIINNTLKEIIG